MIHHGGGRRGEQLQPASCDKTTGRYKYCLYIELCANFISSRCPPAGESSTSAINQFASSTHDESGREHTMACVCPPPDEITSRWLCAPGPRAPHPLTCAGANLYSVDARLRSSSIVTRAPVAASPARPPAYRPLFRRLARKSNLRPNKRALGAGDARADARHSRLGAHSNLSNGAALARESGPATCGPIGPRSSAAPTRAAY